MLRSTRRICTSRFSGWVTTSAGGTVPRSIRTSCSDREDPAAVRLAARWRLDCSRSLRGVSMTVQLKTLPYWIESAPLPHFGPLDSNEWADVVVVGGGITGL